MDEKDRAEIAVAAAYSAIAQCSALMTTITAIIKVLPPDSARQCAAYLREFGARVDAMSIGSSKLPDSVLHEQDDTIRMFAELLESHAAASRGQSSQE